MLNGTVSDARLTLLVRPCSPTRFLIACVHDARPVPFALHGTAVRLYVEHEVDATYDKAHTASYRYVLQADGTHGSWLVRWEYLRERPLGYSYALGHVHVRADFADPARGDMRAKALERLHLPTARVAFELVLRHLIAEWGVQPKTGGWSQLLDARWPASRSDGPRRSRGCARRTASDLRSTVITVAQLAEIAGSPASEAKLARQCAQAAADNDRSTMRLSNLQAASRNDLIAATVLFVAWAISALIGV